MMKWISDLFKTKESTIFNELLEEGALIVDVRSKQEFEAGSVEGAINIPVSQIKKEAKELAKKGHVILFCRSGARSQQAYSILKDSGVDNVYNAGGLRQMQWIMKEFLRKEKV